MFICCRRDDEGKYFWGSGSCISDSGLVPLRTQEGGTMNDQGRSSTDIKRGRPGCHTGRYCTGCMAATHGHDGEARRASRVDSGPSTMTRLGGEWGRGRGVRGSGRVSVTSCTDEPRRHRGHDGRISGTRSCPADRVRARIHSPGVMIDTGGNVVALASIVVN